AVAAKDGIIAINIRSSHMLMAYGFLKKVFEVFEHHKTSVDMITTAEVAVSLTIDDDRNLDKIVADLESYCTITIDKDQTIICVVGAFRKGDAGIAVKVLEPLKDIPIRMISSGGSESNISVLIDSKYKKQALEALNRDLFGHV
ncbi:MAG: ACT domain-containing protein, partial [Saprospiraceae bacterium]